MLEFDDNFFKTEIRDGFEISSMMKRAWAAQMEVLKVVTDICDKNGIKYSAEFGTRLGAVRHKGMIPWDDDIDISLMRVKNCLMVLLWLECMQIVNACRKRHLYFNQGLLQMKSYGILMII